MATYKRLFSICIALAAVLALSEICALIIDYNSPYYDILLIPDIRFPHTFIWFGIYAIMTLSSAECLHNKNLKPCFIQWVFMFSLHLLWMFTVFRLQALETALAISLLLAILCTNLLFAYASITKRLWAAMVPVAAWYIYLFVINFITLIS